MLISKEEREKMQKRLTASDMFLESILNLMPYDAEMNFMRSQHKFQMIDSKAIDEFTTKKLNEEQMKQLTSFYEQATKIVEDILKQQG